ncbi:RNA polymerase sigma-70 factor [Chitinophaga sp.]|uniref:RNA polymerase sigma-70 factor n=1 Tax=Chitinophaga sp. TaxID=1869181 RepID=UPI0031CF8913
MKDVITNTGVLEGYFNEYFEVLHRYAYTILKDNDEAKDVVQIIFMQLWEKRDSISINQSVRAYLYTATHNHCLNRIKSRQTRQRYYDHFATREEWTTTASEDQLNFRELKKEVLQAMETLPEKCREIFYKSRFEEKTYPEIAKELGISLKTVEGQMGKALRILRTLLLTGPNLVIYLLTEIYKLFH